MKQKSVLLSLVAVLGLMIVGCGSNDGDTGDKIDTTKALPHSGEINKNKPIAGPASGGATGTTGGQPPAVTPLRK